VPAGASGEITPLARPPARPGAGRRILIVPAGAVRISRARCRLIFLSRVSRALLAEDCPPRMAPS
jgi:hypothetical protein